MCSILCMWFVLYSIHNLWWIRHSTHMDVCMNIYIHIHLYIYIHTYIYIRIHVWVGCQGGANSLTLSRDSRHMPVQSILLFYFSSPKKNLRSLGFRFFFILKKIFKKTFCNCRGHKTQEDVRSEGKWAVLRGLRSTSCSFLSFITPTSLFKCSL
jgi:hypothetical protein